MAERRSAFRATLSAEFGRSPPMSTSGLELPPESSEVPTRRPSPPEASRASGPSLVAQKWTPYPAARFRHPRATAPIRDPTTTGIATGAASGRSRKATRHASRPLRSKSTMEPLMQPAAMRHEDRFEHRAHP